MDTRWFPFWKRSSDVRARLFCLPHAGGSANVFLDWQRALPNWLEVVAVELPGRVTRLEEAPRRCFRELVEELADVTAPHCDLPFAFLGCSMGSALAFQLSHCLRARLAREPSHLFLAARGGPKARPRPMPDPNASDDEFLRFIEARYGAFPGGVMRDVEMKRLVLTIMRADFALLCDYRYEPMPALRCDITALGGTTDPTVNVEDLRTWAAETSGAFQVHMFPGDHFFLSRNLKDIAGLIEARLTKHARSSANLTGTIVENPS